MQEFTARTLFPAFGPLPVLGKILIIGVIMACMEVGQTLSPGFKQSGCAGSTYGPHCVCIFLPRCLIIAIEQWKTSGLLFCIYTGLTCLGMVSGTCDGKLLAAVGIFMGYFVSIITVDMFSVDTYFSGLGYGG